MSGKLVFFKQKDGKVLQSDVPLSVGIPGEGETRIGTESQDY